MIDNMKIIREVVNASTFSNKEQECVALAQAAWLCLYRIYEISNNEDVHKVADTVSDLNMRQFMNGGDK